MRKLNSTWTWVVRILSFGLVLFQLYTTAKGPFSDITQRSIHLAFVLTLLFILKPAKKVMADNPSGMVPWYDLVASLLSCSACIYLAMNARVLLYDPLKWLGPLDVFFSIALVVLILEASRRSVGWTFPILGSFFLFYAFFGEIFPGIWGHQNFSFNLVFQTFYHNTRGIWGTMLGLSATMLAMLGIFGAILSGTGGAETFIKLGQRFAGKYVGGTGKVAVFASTLFGMISGSAIGNVVATGVFTIPSMKKAGYTPEWAATIESVSSTGGQIMPPIMGAAAFIMSQLIGISYIVIAKAGLVPALLYFTSCLVAVHLISAKQKIQGSGEMPVVKVFELLVILVPLAIFIVYLLIGYTVLIGAFYATIGALITYTIMFIFETKNPKIVGKSVRKVCYTTVMNGTTSIVEMCGILAGSQITVSLINLTGFGVKLSDVIVTLGQGSPLMCLFFSMIVCIVLGMGLPTTAAYVLSAAVLAPPLIALGFQPLMVHLFIMYYASLSAITPPVCVAVFMASGIAKANWMKAGGLSCMIALPAFVIPFTFCYNPALLLIGPVGHVILSIITAFIGVIMIDISVAGYMIHPINMLHRVLFAFGGVLLLFPNIIISITGATVSVLAIVWALSRRKCSDANLIVS